MKNRFDLCQGEYGSYFFDIKNDRDMKLSEILVILNQNNEVETEEHYNGIGSGRYVYYTVKENGKIPLSVKDIQISLKGMNNPDNFDTHEIITRLGFNAL